MDFNIKALIFEVYTSPMSRTDHEQLVILKSVRGRGCGRGPGSQEVRARRGGAPWSVSMWMASSAATRRRAPGTSERSRAWHDAAPPAACASAAGLPLLLLLPLLGAPARPCAYAC